MESRSQPLRSWVCEASWEEEGGALGVITRGHLEEGGALRVGGALLEKQPQLDGLWCGEQDEVELLHHLRGELEILLRP